MHWLQNGSFPSLRGIPSQGGTSTGNHEYIELVQAKMKEFEKLESILEIQRLRTRLNKWFVSK